MRSSSLYHAFVQLMFRYHVNEFVVSLSIIKRCAARHCGPLCYLYDCAAATQP